MKRLTAYLFSLALSLSALAGESGIFPRAIVPGDYADPTVVRDGEDFYMTHSPFLYKPGFLIWHSKDLSTWTPVARALPDWEGSAMAPELVKHGGKFYLYYPSAGTIFVTVADRVEGPWSQPVDLKVKGIDPGHIVDEAGNRYLYVNQGEMVRLAPDGLSAVTEKKQVYDGWDYPQKWVTEGKYLESPKLFRHGGYYYMISAEGGTAGPATSHMVIAARSKSPQGPWENSPYNPMVRTYTDTDSWWSKGHGTVIDDAKGNWWVVYHAYANNNHAMGRQTLIEPVEWTSDGWLRPATTPRSLPESKTAETPLNDAFDGQALGWQWAMWRDYAPSAVKVGGDKLTLAARGDNPGDATVLLTTAMHRNYIVTADVDLLSAAKGGLMLFYSEDAYAGVMADAKNLYVYKGKDKFDKIPNKLGRKFTVKLHNRANRLHAYVSADGKNWTEVCKGIDVAHMNHNKYKRFFALRPALIAQGKGKVAFDNFTYRDGVPTEDDLAAYLMVFHRDETHGLYMALSRDGYTFTALNEGDPIMSGDTIAEQRGIRDPHIYRGPDGAFYVAMTDLHVFAQRDGYTQKQWQRDGYAWGNNKDLVLLKSWDMVNWKRANIHMDQLSPEMKEIGCAWAPETIYDPVAGKMMIYYTMRYGAGRNKLYYVYVNDDFDRVETLPKLLFEYPDQRSSAIDADITYSPTDGLYHMFYVAHEAEGGIKQATAPTPTGPWTFDPRWYDFEPKACEAPTVWKRIGQDKWVLMYDVFSVTPHNFGFTETSDFQSFDHLQRFNEGVMKTTNFTAPKHGAVVRLTKAEADSLENYWAANRRPYVRQAGLRQNPVLQGYNADPYAMYSEKTGRYYIYPTSDGHHNWNTSSFSAWSSADLKDWRREGEIVNLRNVSWADKNAWAPTIIEKKQPDGSYRYYYYYTADKQIGVAVANDPAGPFTDAGKPVVERPLPAGTGRGQNIDPDVFCDPATGKNYLYWGNCYMAVAELEDDMVSLKPGTTRVLIKQHPLYSEGTHVFYRDGWYYIMWSNNDTRSPEYCVRYIKTKDPLAPIDPAKSTVILSKNTDKGILGTGHHSVLRLPGTDEWRIVYHRFRFPDAINLGWNAGFHREVCIDEMKFDENGDILPVEPTI